LVPLNSIDEPGSLAKLQLTVFARADPTPVKSIRERVATPQTIFFLQVNTRYLHRVEKRLSISLVSKPGRPCDNGNTLRVGTE
jgi:hypothetical protein